MSSLNNRSVITTRQNSSSTSVDSSLFSFMSIAIILLAFFVSINADRHHKIVIEDKINNSTTSGELDSDIEQSTHPILKIDISLDEIFRPNSTDLTANGPEFAKQIAQLLIARPARLLVTISQPDSRDFIELTTARATTLHRLFLDAQIPSQLFRILAKEAHKTSVTAEISIFFDEIGDE